MSKLKLSAKRRAKLGKSFVERKTAEHWERVANGVKTVVNSKERYIIMPEGYSFGESSKTVGGRSVKKIIGVKTVRKTRLQKDFSETVIIETEHKDLGDGRIGEKIGERERVSRKLKDGENAEYYYTSDDHAKKSKGIGKASKKSQYQRETANADKIIAKGATDTIEMRLQIIWENLPSTYELSLSNFRRKMYNSESFRKKLSKKMKWDFSFMDNALKQIAETK